MNHGPSEPAYTIVGRVRKAHGIRGELVVEPVTDAPEAIFASGRRVFAGTTAGDAVDPPRALTIRRSSPFKGGWIVAFTELSDRNEAELWRERYLLLPTVELPPLADDEVYQHDLLGMRVERVSGEALGAVTALFELPQGLMLELGGLPGAPLLPYRPEIVTRVDVEQRVIVVDPPEGLLD